MVKKKSQRKQPRSKPARVPRRPPFAHLLIIECDADKLAAERLSLGTNVFEFLKGFPSGKRIEFLPTSTADHLSAEFAAVMEKHTRFTNVLVVGHSNSQGLRLARDAFVKWPVLANWLTAFEPKNILLITCEGARFEGVSALFEGIKSLRNVFGSPVDLHPGQAGPLIIATLALLNGEHIPEHLKMAVQLVSFATTGGIPYRWTRQEVLKKEIFEGQLWNALADALKGRG